MMAPEIEKVYLDRDVNGHMELYLCMKPLVSTVVKNGKLDIGGCR
jgi:hypothetical protein